jgi:hypothetical protein
VQMDHTLVDIMVVDESPPSIDRPPWITVAFDIAMRVVLGSALRRFIIIRVSQLARRAFG